MSAVEIGYRSNPALKRTGIQLNFTQEQVEEYIKCASDPVYFVENYVKIINVDEGVIPFKLYGFQKDMIRTIHENRRVVGRIGRQSGKSQTTIAYILWSSLFNDTQNIVILANKGSLAIDLIDRYQMAFENLPMWLQQGVVVWNKGSIELENGSKVRAAATSSSAIRGGSYTHVVLDEFAHIHNNLAEEFFTSVYPVISSGEKTKITIISTPNGMNLFYKIFTDAKAKKNDYACIDVHWSQVPGRTDKWKDEFIRNTSQRQFNQEIGCEFLGSTNTLISGEKLATLTYKEPISKMADVVIYEKPIKEEFDDETQDQISTDHLYAIVVDVSEGKNLDYSAFSVFDVSMIPYRQVAVYRNNNIPPMIFPNIIKSCAEYYNDAHVLIEINNSPQVAEILLEDLEYENVFKITSGNKKAQTLSLGSGRRVSYGLKTSPLSKRVGCSTLKTLIENDKLIINDFETISELTTFVNNGKSFAAEEGCNDDLAMTLVNFGWLVTQKLFKEMVDNDIRKQLQLEHFEYIEEDQLPLGENYKGNEIPFYIEDDAVWVEVGKNSSQNDYGDFYKSFISF
nr:MAG: hypothetical protein [Caudoviricetes sp.]